jgi:hypothetical protein
MHTAYIYVYTQQQTNFLGARESLESKLTDIFCRFTLLFPSLTILYIFFTRTPMDALINRVLDLRYLDSKYLDTLTPQLLESQL